MSVSTFVGGAEEIDTKALLLKLIESKGCAFVPRVVDPDGGLALHRVNHFPHGFSPGAFGILEPDPEVYPETVVPERLGAIFVPGVVFDRAGRRLGYGKGYYDRMLGGADAAFKVGLGFELQVVDALPEESHDVRLDALITEDGVLEFVRGS